MRPFLAEYLKKISCTVRNTNPVKRLVDYWIPSECAIQKTLFNRRLKVRGRENGLGFFAENLDTEMSLRAYSIRLKFS